MPGHSERHWPSASRTVSSVRSTFCPSLTTTETLGKPSATDPPPWRYHPSCPFSTNNVFVVSLLVDPAVQQPPQSQQQQQQQQQQHQQQHQQHRSRDQETNDSVSFHQQEECSSCCPSRTVYTAVWSWRCSERWSLVLCRPTLIGAAFAKDGVVERSFVRATTCCRPCQ